MTMENIKQIFIWLLSLHDETRLPKNAAGKLLMSMRVTAKCRFYAAARLERQAKFAFFTTTYLSLGLIFIPLMQNAGIKLAFQSNVLNMMSIFLAVSILVYSVVIGTARYDLRAENLTKCGNKLKELIRELGVVIEGEFNDENSVKSYQERYAILADETENHTQSDYVLAMLEMPRDYKITGVIRPAKFLFTHLRYGASYIVPLFFIVVETVFILDMLKATQILTPYLN